MLDNWQTYKIGELFEFKNGLNKGKEFFGHGTPIVNYMDVYKNSFLHNGNIMGLVEVSEKEKNNYSVNKGDVLFTRTSETIEEIGYAAVMKEQINDAVFSGFVLRARPLTDILDIDFCGYCFRTTAVRKDIMKRGSYTTRALTSGTSLSEVKIHIPKSKEEQHKIAEILKCVEAEIEDVEAKIQDNTILKKALAKKLLTEGIGHTEFKDSEVGRIPAEWEDCNINTVAKRNTGHTPDKKHDEYWNGNIAWISLKDLGKLDSREICETYSCTTDLGIENSSAVVLDKGTVVISRDATVGKIGIMGIDMATSQHFVNFTCGKRLSCKYLYYWLLGHQEDFKKIAIGSTIKTIGMKYFEKMRIALPELEEQEKIANILWNMDDCIENCKNQHTDLTQLKEALS